MTGFIKDWARVAEKRRELEDYGLDLIKKVSSALGQGPIQSLLILVSQHEATRFIPIPPEWDDFPLQRYALH